MKTVLGGWGRVLSVGASIVVLKMGAVASQDTSGEGGSFTEKIKEWQEKVSDAFRDSWQRLSQDRATRTLISRAFQGLFIRVFSVALRVDSHFVAQVTSAKRALSSIPSLEALFQQVLPR
jgi:hypothetical protein